MSDRWQLYDRDFDNQNDQMLPVHAFQLLKPMHFEWSALIFFLARYAVQL